MRRLTVAILTIASTVSATAEGVGGYPPCKNAGLEYTEGATMCECPTIKAVVGYATGSPPGSVISRRLTCTKGSWVSANENCAEITGGSAFMSEHHKKLQDMYCPRSNFAEQAAGYIEKATASQGLVIVGSLCKRFAIPPGVCSGAIEAISKIK
jgi:hypothetical protein